MNPPPNITHPLLRPRGYAGLGVHIGLNGDELIIVARSREGLARVWERLDMPGELDLDRVQGCIVSSANLISSAIEMASNIGEEGGQ